MSARIGVRNGAVYLSAETVATYFPGIATVAILIREGRLMVAPVHHAGAGGCLLKIRNAAGDRVALAADVFQANGLGDFRADDLAADWSAESGALTASLIAN